ncbi:DUF952 domain-containing protein [Paracoccus sp. WLY502]|uniref:DUF952 domain-containing protein n=1 Tax=Paracoccus yibinensis TaxID=3068891 RepID=UPI002796AF7C|nr:DUF952 domain-containing protein [Paracoccus sp. WLY502]MDQ1899769.1 DUF952 domain-containing protein [Paracoccus sp. WLY502]
MMIYKVLRPAEWADLQAAGASKGAPVDLADGYVHFSTAAQLGTTLTKHFADEGDLLLLGCDAAVFGGDLRWEPSRGGDLFPHLYRPLTLDDIAWSRIISRSEDGHDTGPLE